MSFRSEFVDKLNSRYADDVLKRKSLDAAWSRIHAYFRTFIEDIANVKDFAIANYDDRGTELSLRVEGHELSFRRHNDQIEAIVNAQYIDDFAPTVDGHCLNFKEQELMEMIDQYMKMAFYNTFIQL